MPKLSSDALFVGPYEVVGALHRSAEVSRFACSFPAPHGVRLVGVSVLPESTAERVLDSAQLLERIAAVRNLQHALIPELLDVALRGDRLYTVESLAEGIPLRELLEAMRSDGRRLDPETGAALLSDIAGALIHAQERPAPAGYPARLFHGALSTDTVIVTLRGELRLEQFALGPWLCNRAGLTPLDGCLEDVRAIARIGAEAMLGNAAAVGLSSRQMASEGLPDEIAQMLEAAMLQPAERSAEALSSMRASLQLWLRSRPSFSTRHRLRTLLFTHLSVRAGSSLPPDAVSLKRADFSFIDAGSLAAERQAEPEPLSHALLAACAADGFVSYEAASNAQRAIPLGAPNPTPGAGSPVLPAFGRTRGASLALSAFDAEMFSGETLAVPMPSDYLPEVARGAMAPQPQQPAQPSYRPARTASVSVTGSHLWQGSESSTGNAPVEPASKDRLSSVFAAMPTQRVRSRRWMLIGAVSAAALLYGLFSWQKSVKPQAADAQQILLTSSPLGARVVIGGIETGAVTPTTLVGTSIGEIKTLTVRREGFETPPVGTADITSTVPLSLLFTLKPLPHTIRVESNPPGATVTLNGTPCGSTPTVCMPIYVDPSDGATLEFRRDGFGAAIIPHSWEPGLSQSTVTQTLLPLKGQSTVPKAADKGKAKDKPKAAKKVGNSKEPKPADTGTATPPAATEKPN
jgi:PEGA domain